MMTSAAPLKLGWIPFWNLWPLRAELETHCAAFVQFKSAAPVKVNSWIKEGKVDIAPCSSINLLGQAELEVALPLGVVTNGAVLSVYIGVKKEDARLNSYLLKRRKELKAFFAEAATCCKYNPIKMAKLLRSFLLSDSPKLACSYPNLKFSSQSATGRALAKIFYLLWFGKDAYRKVVVWGMKDPLASSFELLIGDQALACRKNYQQVLDLGALWKEMCGLPFVYAVWQKRKDFSFHYQDLFLELATLAEARMRVDPQQYLPDPLPKDWQGASLPLQEYWKKIYYRLAPLDMQGLLLFLATATSLKIVQAEPQVLEKMTRWQELSFSPKVSLYS